MRANLVSPSSAHLSYAIREIVKFAEVVRSHGVEITWENIGDPIAKGETVEPWIRDIVHEVVDIEDPGATAPPKASWMCARRWPRMSTRDPVPAGRPLTTSSSSTVSLMRFPRSTAS